MPSGILIGALVHASIARVHALRGNIDVPLQRRIMARALQTVHKCAHIIVTWKKAPSILNDFHRSLVDITKYWSMVCHCSFPGCDYVPVANCGLLSACNCCSAYTLMSPRCRAAIPSHAARAADRVVIVGMRAVTAARRIAFSSNQGSMPCGVLTIR